MRYVAINPNLPVQLTAAALAGRQGVSHYAGRIGTVQSVSGDLPEYCKVFWPSLGCSSVWAARELEQAPDPIADDKPEHPAFTPGPWYFVDDVPGAEIGYRAIVAQDGELICNPSPMGAANASLIANAPALYAALEEALAAMGRMDTRLLRLTGSPNECEKGEIVRARAALALARK